MISASFSTDSFILLGALLLIIGVVVTKFSSKLGMPSLILFILVGMIMGSDGLGIIFFDNVEYAQLIGIIALVIILFEGGSQTEWPTIKKVLGPSLSLATLGVVLTSAIVGVAAKLIVDLSWTEAFLLGSIVGSTDAAAVFAALKERNIKTKIGATLEAESGTNDPMAVFLTVAFIELVILDEPSYLLLIGSFFWQMGLGLVMGIVLGKIASLSINRINLDSSGLYPIFAIFLRCLLMGWPHLPERADFLRYM